MNLIKKIKDVIFKIKDYDRLESDYCSVLDYATGGVLSKSNYTLESVYEAISDYEKQREKEFQRPAEQIQKILDSVGEHDMWMVLTKTVGGRWMTFFRDGYRIKESELTDDEKSNVTSWCHCILNDAKKWNKKEYKR